MTAGDVASGKNHHHQGRADSERRDDAATTIDDCTPDGEHEEKGSDEFHNILVHSGDLLTPAKSNGKLRAILKRPRIVEDTV